MARNSNNPNIVNVNRDLEDEVSAYDRRTQQELQDLKNKLRIEGIKEGSEQELKYLKILEKRQEYNRQQLIKKNHKDLLNMEKDLQKQRLKDLEQERKERNQMYMEELELKQKGYQEDLKHSKNIKEFSKALGGLASTSIKQTWLSDGGKKLSDTFNGMFSSIDAGMKQVMSSFSKYQSTINTRLQGSGQSWDKGFGYAGLYNSLMSRVGINPYIKTQDMLSNLSKLVEQGIAFNLEQRTFLATVSEKVASTFDAFDSNLSRIIRIQQADSTAARLGMEAFMTQFLNSMFSDTSYLSGSYDTVTQSLLEATSQLSTQGGVEFESIIQKWLGSLSSVGLSDNTVGGLAQALSYLATGNVEGLSSSGMQNLLVMAASKGGMSVADMLTRGITLDETNTLLANIVGYLQEIGNSTNQVVKNQYASTFGVSLSDIRAAQNLTSEDIENISKTNLGYQGAISELYDQLNSVASRTSLAEMLSNVWDNTTYSLYSNIAGNPAFYALWQVTDLIQGLTGGINIPFISAMGSGVDINTTVENLMKLGIVGISSLGMIGDVISGVTNSFQFSNAAKFLGIGNDIITTPRGNAYTRESGFGTSNEQYISQSSGDVFYQSTLSAAKESAQEDLANETSGKKDLNDVYQILSDGSAKVTLYNFEEKAELNQLNTISEYLSDIRGEVISINSKLANRFTPISTTPEGF